MRRAPAGAAVAALAVAVAVLLAGCFDVQSPDLFLLTRTGQGGKLTLLVNDGGTIRCDGAKAKPISDNALVTARDLSDNLVTDAQNKLDDPPGPGLDLLLHDQAPAGDHLLPRPGRRDPQGPGSGRAVRRSGRPAGMPRHRLRPGCRRVRMRLRRRRKQGVRRSGWLA